MPRFIRPSLTFVFLYFPQMCHLAEDSIRKALDENDNAAHLLSLHRPQHHNHESFASEMESSMYNTRFIKIK